MPNISTPIQSNDTKASEANTNDPQEPSNQTPPENPLSNTQRDTDNSHSNKSMSATSKPTTTDLLRINNHISDLEQKSKRDLQKW
eukprot:5004778-Ditylum_brightwellii.AAC.2